MGVCSSSIVCGGFVVIPLRGGSECDRWEVIWNQMSGTHLRRGNPQTRRPLPMQVPSALWRVLVEALRRTCWVCGCAVS